MKRGTALITGGAKRIGKAIILRLVKEGYDIALHYSTSRANAEELQKIIIGEGAECSLFQFNFEDKRAPGNLISGVFADCPDCNLLVNNASIFERFSFAGSTDDVFDRCFDINFRAPFILTREFAVKCAKGNVVNMLDSKIIKNFTEYFVYSLTKKALRDFTYMAAKELAPSVRVNAICPGVILPPEGIENPDLYVEKMGAKTPMKKEGAVEDIISALMFILDNHYVTGECLNVDGGDHLR